jgi:hypothetical protein
MPAAMQAKVLFHPLRDRVMHADMNRGILNRIRNTAVLQPAASWIKKGALHYPLYIPAEI